MTYRLQTSSHILLDIANFPWLYGTQERVNMTNTLVEFWQKCDLSSAPYFHPEDKCELEKKNETLVFNKKVKSYQDYIGSPEFSCFDTSKFHLSLIPIPYAGNLEKADIIILLLNPGFSHTDYYGELEDTDYRKALENNLRQDFSKTDFPFLWLNPEFCWHSGFVYWEKKFRGILKIIAKNKHNGSYFEALHDLSQRIAMIELVPYHSAKFSDNGLIKKLPSTTEAIQYVHKSIAPEALTGNKLLIVTRQKKSWQLDTKEPHIIVYEGSETRSANLSPTSKGGKAILKHYNL